MPHPASHSDLEGSAERADFMCSHALSQVALAAASACRLRAPRRTVEAPAPAWPHGETHGFACHSGCASRLVASDGFAAIAASARVRGCHWQRLVVRPAAVTSRAERDRRVEFSPGSVTLRLMPGCCERWRGRTATPRGAFWPCARMRARCRAARSMRRPRWATRARDRPDRTHRLGCQPVPMTRAEPIYL